MEKHNETLMKTPKAPIIALIALLIIGGTIGGIKYTQIQATKAASANLAFPPSAVNVFTVEKQVWSRSRTAVGTLQAEEGITVAAEVSGRVESIHFRSGESVEAGTLLLTQDSGNEVAQLKSARAQLRLAESNFKRISSLRKQNTVSASQFEGSRQELESAKANVQNLNTTLQKKQLRAPFSGHLGIRKVDLGQDLQVGDRIVDLQAQDQLKVNFTMPQRWVSDIQTGLTVEVNMIEVKDPVVKGSINAIGAEVDLLTRNIEVQATLDDANKLLLPGMAVEVRVELPTQSEQLVIPSTAVVYAPFGDTVFVIEKNDESGQLHARQQFVKIAERRGDFVAIAAGLNPGEQVASSGAFKLFNGQNVVISENKETTYSLNPEPSDS